MNNQFELFTIEKKSENKPKKKNFKDYSDTGHRHINVEKTENIHTCGKCGKQIPVGSKATEIIHFRSWANKKLGIDSAEYFHLKGKCPESHLDE